MALSRLFYNLVTTCKSTGILGSFESLIYEKFRKT